MFRSTLAIAVLAFAASGTASFASDLAISDSAPVAEQSGFYAGVFGGYASSRTTLSFEGDPDRTIDGNGGILGGTIGYNANIAGNVVLGGEAKLGFGKLDGSYTGGLADPGY